MVHYKDYFLLTGAADYWKLRTQESGSATKRLLDKNGVAFTKTSSSTRLADLNSRYQRGLPCYDKFKTSELQAFCKARGLTPRQRLDKVPSRVDLAATLEAADDSKTFNHFMDLPSELRVEIYKLHFQTLTTPQDLIPAQPPLTKICRLVRHESIPLFYDTCDFALEIHGKNYYSEIATNMRFIQAAGLPTFPEGLQGAPQPLGHLLKRLYILANVWAPSNGRVICRMRYKVGFEATAGDVKMNIERDNQVNPDDKCADAEAELGRRDELVRLMFVERSRKTAVMRGDKSKVRDGEEEGARHGGHGRALESKHKPRQNDNNSRLMIEDTDWTALMTLSFVHSA